MLFDQGGIDLVLLDIMLPGKNGDQVLKAIREQSQTPVIMLTALSDKKLISQYLLDGANDYIIKPFDLDEVFARVTVQLRQSAEKQPMEIGKTENLPQNLKNIQFDEGAVKPKLEEVDLSAFITKKTLAYYDVFQAANITLDFKVEAGLKTRTDEDLLDRILQNLLGNVLKHGKEEARLSLRKEKEQLVLEIANLVKQPIKRIENLSNRFYSENLSDTEESSGLGLYITEELCHLLGAEMKLSTDGQWLSVFIYF